MTKCDATEPFEAARAKLSRVAYRMLGSLADADDILQEAFLRWCHTDRTSVRSPEAFLVRVVTRLSLDELKSAKRRRETYAGPWLPEPVVQAEPGPDDDVTLPLLLALERLSPLERAAFLLHDVFGMPFEDVATTIGRDAAAARQLASRARQHVHDARPRFAVDREKGLAFAEAFFTASRSGDLSTLKSMLVADAIFVADGGGKRPAGDAPFTGLDAVLDLFAGLAKVFVRAPSQLVRYCTINGLPGFVTIEGDGMAQTTAFDIRGDRIAAIYVMRNPDKLRHLEGAVLH